MDDISIKKDDFFKEEQSLVAFEALERDFSDFIASLHDNPVFSQVRLEHEKLFRALKKSCNQEKRLLKRCRELNGEIMGVTSKLQAAHKLSKDDQTAADKWKGDTEKAWGMASESHEKELKALDTIVQLQQEITNLNSYAENNRKLVAFQEASLGALTMELGALQKKSDQEVAQLRLIEQRSKEERKRTHGVETDLVEAQLKLRSNSDEANERQSELLREKRRGEKLEIELQVSQSSLEKASAHGSNLQLEVDLSAKENVQMQKEIHQFSVAYDKCVKTLESVNLALKNSVADLLEQKEKNDSVSNEVKELLHEAKVSRNDQLRQATEKAQLEKKLNERNHSIIRLKKISDDLRESVLQLQTENNALNQEQESLKSREDRLRRDAAAMEREKELHLCMIQKSHLKVKEADTEVHKNEQIHLSLEKELLHVKEEVKKQQSIIRQLEREIERGEKEVSFINAAYEELKNDLRMKQLEVTELQQQLSENEVTSRQLQQDTAQSERLKFSKRAMDDQREIDDLSGNLKALTNEISQLKGEINAKELEIAKKSFEHQKEHTRNDRHQNELSQLRKMLLEKEVIVEQRDTEVRLLSGAVHHIEEECMGNIREKEQTLKERDILATQLVRRNDELALLYEKIKILQIMLRKGEFQYRERLDNIRLLKLKIKDLQRDKATGMRESVTVHKYKKELIQTHRELLGEKNKVKSLSEELENPLNIHRWRRLEGSDPATFEMIQKMQSLQKRMIRKTEEMIDRDIIIQEQEKNNLELQKRLSRQPGPDVIAQLAKCRRDMNEKARKVDALTGELVMYQTKYHAQQEDLQREKDNNAKKKMQHSVSKDEEVGATKFSRIMTNVSEATQRQELKETKSTPALKILGGGFVL